MNNQKYELELSLKQLTSDISITKKKIEELKELLGELEERKEFVKLDLEELLK